MLFPFQGMEAKPDSRRIIPDSHRSSGSWEKKAGVAIPWYPCRDSREFGLSQHSHGSSSILFLIPWFQTPPGAAAAPSRGKGGGGSGQGWIQEIFQPPPSLFPALQIPGKSLCAPFLIPPPAPHFQLDFPPRRNCSGIFTSLGKLIQGSQLRQGSGPSVGGVAAGESQIPAPVIAGSWGRMRIQEFPGASPFPAFLWEQFPSPNPTIPCSFGAFPDSGEPKPSRKILSQLLVPLPFFLSSSRD